MKKFYLIILFILNTIFCYSQRSEVLGIPFGISIEEVEKVLDNRFSTLGKFKGSDVVEYRNGRVGPVFFSTLQFYFKPTFNGNIFYKSWFSENYKNDVNRLKKDRESIREQIANKYSYILPYTNDIGFKCYKFGFSKANIVGEVSVSVMKKDQGLFPYDVYYLELIYEPHDYKAIDF